MANLRVKTFLLDYLLAVALVSALFLAIAANIPASDPRLAITLGQACGNANLNIKAMEDVNSVLKKTESCRLVSPCVELTSLECQGGVETLGSLVTNMFAQNSLQVRIIKVLAPYGIRSSDGSKSLRLISSDLFLLILAYGYMLIVAFSILFALWRQNLLRQTFAIPNINRQKTLLYPALMAIAVGLTIYFIGSILEHISPWQESPNAIFFSQLSTPTLFLLAVVLAPLVEELVFRGVFLRFFVERGWLITGSILVSIVFANIHGFYEETLIWQLFHSVSYFVISMVLCWLYIKNKTLWSPIILHSVYNCTALFIYLLSK